MRRSQQIKVLANKFLLREYMEDKKAKTNFLTLFEKYRDFIAEEATGYGLEGKDFEREILERFPNTKIDGNHNIVGLGPRVYQEPPPIDPIIKKIGKVLVDLIENSFSARTSGLVVMGE